MILRKLAIAGALASVMGLAACATPSNPGNMTLPASAGLTATAGDLGYHSVTKVDVSGGKETNPLWTAQVSSEAFKKALEDSLALAGYMGTDGPPMQVQANLVNLRQPFAGFDLSVTSEVRYTVTRDGRSVFDETVSATGTASMGESFMAVERLRMANEKSIQENIKAFLTRFRARAH
ncbi:MAG TPA: hypothetical protein VF633_01730 [Brevundimonas sp.]|jgi:hypothetical protein